MMKDALIRTLKMDCPVCDREHEVEERRRTSQVTIKGIPVEYEEVYYVCANANEDENEFAPAKVFDKNMLNARNAYRRKKGLLTSEEICKIRESYELTQSELSNLLGWGEVTISRYESKAIQDESYDNILRIIKENPMEAYNFLLKNKDNFKPLKYLGLKERIMQKLDENGKEFLSRQYLKSYYVNYQEESDLNGYSIINIDKLECIISYLAKRMPQLYKVKLMKLLWYIDVISYKKFNHSMTGLIYSHAPMGALPIAFDKIIELENVWIKEEIHNDFDRPMCHILANDNMDLSILSSDELDIVDCVINKFKHYKSNEIVNYMHKEKAYLETDEEQIIPFSLAKELREF